ncbi:amyloid fiber anchoring/assembly protein TapA [Halalkalibacillus sediminis]|uniref:Amyloid fiber anchoring/assembly protein TapA n=1 Tax=Halalkalibacillus sediminis TaxID=2018042 RepID=A0A2I0QS81_9BACI|nr:amyloid fiber anchoring/assembly protein TapA [Halalkalibacillus sediminis]PKR77202.1 amyloid fiber anchoring/assembly protein TapA [Halalkalibacillus sediminis]
MRKGRLTMMRKKQLQRRIFLKAFLVLYITFLSISLSTGGTDAQFNDVETIKESISTCVWHVNDKGEYVCGEGDWDNSSLDFDGMDVGGTLDELFAWVKNGGDGDMESSWIYYVYKDGEKIEDFEGETPLIKSGDKAKLIYDGPIEPGDYKFRFIRPDEHANGNGKGKGKNLSINESESSGGYSSTITITEEMFEGSEIEVQTMDVENEISEEEDEKNSIQKPQQESQENDDVDDKEREQSDGTKDASEQADESDNKDSKSGEENVTTGEDKKNKKNSSKEDKKETSGSDSQVEVSEDNTESENNQTSDEESDQAEEDAKKENVGPDTDKVENVDSDNSKKVNTDSDE